jgi:hypothetical protein
MRRERVKGAFIFCRTVEANLCVCPFGSGALEIFAEAGTIESHGRAGLEESRG